MRSQKNIYIFSSISISAFDRRLQSPYSHESGECFLLQEKCSDLWMCARWCTMYVHNRYRDIGKIHFLCCHIALVAFNIGKLVTAAAIDGLHRFRLVSPSHTRIHWWFNRKRWIYYWSEEEHITIFHRWIFLLLTFFASSSSFCFRYLISFCVGRMQHAHWLTIRAATRLSISPLTVNARSISKIWMSTIFHLFFSFHRLYGSCTVI